MGQKSSLIIGLAVIILLAAALFLIPKKDEDTSEETPTPTPTATVTSSADATTPATTKEFTVTGTNMAFSLKEIKVNEGDTVKIIFKNQSGSHDFVLDDFDVASAVLDPGQEEILEFVASKKGSFEYYCSVSNHRAMGMKGMLIVE